MTIERFKASVQYDDWKGTSAADNADKQSLRNWLKEQGHIRDDEFLLGIEMLSGECHTETVTVKFLMTPGNFDAVETMIKESAGPIRVRIFRLEMQLTQFFGFFKRFNITLSNRNMLEGQEYHFDD